MRWRAITVLAAASTVMAQAKAQPSQQTCVDVKVGTAQSYACLNQQLGAVANQAHRAEQDNAPAAATSPGNVTGQFNQDATRERLGSNFGRSVTPQRPAAANPPPIMPR
jgi:hypothetical protein